MTYALDASAVVAWLQGEPGGSIVAELLAESRHRFVIHELNLCEVLYDGIRRVGEVRAERALSTTPAMGIEIVAPAGPWRAAARLKAKWKRVSLADCFALATAQTLAATLLTTDRHELEPLAEAGVCSIRFLR